MEMGKSEQMKLQFYGDKLYRGILNRYKEQQVWEKFYTRAVRVERKSYTPSQKCEVIDRSGNQCEICGTEDDTEVFELHHINGDSSYSIETNLLLVYPTCHSRVHNKANSKLANYKVRVLRRTEKTKKKITKSKSRTSTKPKLTVPGTDIEIDNPL
jgi:hypothetical protein